MIKHLTTRLALLCLGASAMPSLAADYVLTQETAHVTPLTRGKPYTTHFGWDVFEAPTGATLLDTTPDLGNTAIVGAKFETTNGQLHRASSTGNYYTGSSSTTSMAAETITVPTSGTVGVTGKTTILVQLIGTGAFPNTWTFSNINGVAPQVVQGTNKGAKGQVWVKWELTGNAATYEFNLSTAVHPSFGGAHMSFDKMEIDTFWSPTGASIGDTMILSEPAALASTLELLSTFATPSSRGTSGTTYFGWDTFAQEAGPPKIINDNTPDIGSDSTGLARFRTANGELHQMAPNANVYLLDLSGGDLTLDEDITVPTNGVVGTAGYTTIILQIASAVSGNGGAEFANVIYLGPINGVEPTVVQGKSANSAQLWAKWVVPGNQPTYTINVDGVPKQQHYSFDKVIVDTKYSPYTPVADTMRKSVVEISTSTLASGLRGTAYSAQLAANGGTNPLTWSLATGSTLPAGLELSAGGLISGTPTAAGNTTFTVVATDAGTPAYKNQVTYAFEILAPVAITSTTLSNAVTGLAYSTTLTAEGGRSTYQWALASGSTLPTGLELSSAGVISGTPSVQGSTTFSVVVTDSSTLTATTSLTLEVAPPVAITSTTLPLGVVGVPYTATLVAEGGQGSHEWAVATGSLPAGLELSDAGVISGTPTAAGTATVSIKVTDSSDATVTKSFDITISNLAIVTTALPTGVVNVDYVASVQGAGGVTANYLWNIAPETLPAGVSFNTSTGVFSGKPTAAGTTPLTVQLTDGLVQYTRSIDLVVSASYLKPVVDPITFPTATIGAVYNHTVTAANYPKTFSITGLPKGLTYKAATGEITGRPSVSGAYLVQVRATNSAGASVIRPGTLVVKALPVNLIGTFTGLIERDSVNTGLGSLFNLTTTTTGAFTLQVKTGSATKSFKGFLGTSSTQIEASVNGADLEIAIDVATGLITGTHGEADIEGWRTKWEPALNPASGREGYYSVALNLSDEDDLEDADLPQGTGFATFSVVPAGTLKIAGKTADGQAITTSTALGPNGEIAFYSTAYANKGTLLGKWTLEDNDFLGNTVEGDLTWQKPATTGLNYPAAFGPLDVAVQGGYLAPSAKGPVMAGLPDEGSIQVEFESGGIDTYSTFADNQIATGFGWTENMTVTSPSAANNPGAVTLKINKATGAVTGTFTATEDTTVRKNVAFQAQIVTLPDGTVKAAGYFLLPQIPTGTQKPTATPILSGSVFVTQPAAPAP